MQLSVNTAPLATDPMLPKQFEITELIDPMQLSANPKADEPQTEQLCMRPQHWAVPLTDDPQDIWFSSFPSTLT
tara:strand:- start:1194 stop:1415 length:222 start_codon:yes stop_codon:yes gene_type:complete